MAKAKSKVGSKMPKRVFKTKKKLTTGQKEFRKWNEYEMDDCVIGTYVGEHKDQYNKIGRIIKVEDAQFADGSGEELAGKNLVLNSNGMLDKAFNDNDIQPGEMVQIVYKGTAEIQKGKYAGKDAHVVEVETVVPEDEDIDDEEDEDDDSELDEDDEYGDDL